MKKSNVIKINEVTLGRPDQDKKFSPASSANWIAFLDSEPQMAIRLALQNLINTYGLAEVESITTFVLQDVKKDAA